MDRKFQCGAALAALVLMTPGTGWSREVPFTFVNRSPWPDAEVFVAVVGEIGGHVWIDPRTGSVRSMDVSDNTVQGPTIGGNKGPGGNGLYANCFAPLSEIPDRTIRVPAIAGSRILVAFGSRLYLYFFGYSGGYAAPNLANPTDPNQGIRYEMIELTNDANGIWANTTRVDSYQYPMGLEIRGDGGYLGKTGELLDHRQIMSTWKNSVSEAFRGCLVEKDSAIVAPSKTAAFQAGGAQADFFKDYVDAIWAKYANEDLVFDGGETGIWRGRVVGGRFVFRKLTVHVGNDTGIIVARPSTQEVLEGKGVLSQDVQKRPGQKLDQVVQALFCAAVNRHAIDLAAAPGATQIWSDTSKWYKTEPFNEYAGFWHRSGVSWERRSYGFCYDDVFEQSSTIHAVAPVSATVTLGGYAFANVGIRRDGVASRRVSATLSGRTVRLDDPAAAGTFVLTGLDGATVAAARMEGGVARLDAIPARGAWTWRLEGNRAAGGALVVAN